MARLAAPVRSRRHTFLEPIVLTWSRFWTPLASEDGAVGPLYWIETETQLSNFQNAPHSNYIVVLAYSLLAK